MTKGYNDWINKPIRVGYVIELLTKVLFLPDISKPAAVRI